MKLISRYPFEALVFFVLVYYSGILFFFEPTNLWNKVVFFLIALTVFITTVILGFTFRVELNSFRKKFFGVFLTGIFHKSSIFLKLYHLLTLSTVPFFLSSLVEFLLTYLFTQAGAITIGFPLPVYSFSAHRFLLVNILADFLVFCLIIYFLGTVVARDPDITDY